MFPSLNSQFSLMHVLRFEHEPQLQMFYRQVLRDNEWILLCGRRYEALVWKETTCVFIATRNQHFAYRHLTTSREIGQNSCQGQKEVETKCLKTKLSDDLKPVTVASAYAWMGGFGIFSFL
jgi:hypothetical protein